MSADLATTLANRVLELEQRLAAYEPNPKFEYKVLFKCEAGLFYLSHWYHTSLEDFAEQNKSCIPVQLVIATGRQKYE